MRVTYFSRVCIQHIYQCAVFLSERHSLCIFVCPCLCVPDVYEPLRVGVCSCVYPVCSEIVTELHKQFIVNRPFPNSNNGQMRLNSVPPNSPSVMKTGSEANQSTARHPFILSVIWRIRLDPSRPSNDLKFESVQGYEDQGYSREPKY